MRKRTPVWLFVAGAVLGGSMAVSGASGQRGKDGAAGDFDRLSQQAERAQRDGKSREAISLYLRALEIRPKWADGWQSTGMLLADRKDYKRAVDAFQNLVSVDPQRGAGWALLGLSEYELGRDDAAYRHLQRGRALGVGNADLEKIATFHAALIVIAKAQFEVGHHLLVEVVRDGASDDPDLSAAFGLAALRLAAKPESLAAGKRDLVMRVGQIELEAAENKVPEVIAAYQQLLHEHPKTPGLHYAFGNFLIGAEHYEEGLRQMQQELTLDPGNVMALLQTTMSDIKLGRAGDGIPNARKAVGLAPRLFVAHYALGWALFKAGEVAPAVPELELAAKLAPDSAQAHYALSEAYMRANRRQDAYRQRTEFARLKNQQAEQSQSAATRAASQSSESGAGRKQ